MANVALSRQKGAQKSDTPAGKAAITTEVIAPGGGELSVLAFFSALGALGLMLEGPLVAILNFVMPLVLVLAIGWGAIASMKASALVLWAPLLWFRAAVLFYAGIGTLLLYALNDAERTYLEFFFALFPYNILAYNVVNMAFAFCVLATAKLVLGARYQVGIKGFATRTPSHMPLQVIGLAFLLVGLAVRVVLIMPYQFKFAEGTYPAIYHEISQLLPISFYLLTLVYVKQKSINRFWVYLLAVTFSGVGLLALSKTEVLIPLLMVILALLQIKPSFKRLALSLTAIVAIYIFSAGPVNQGRSLMNAKGGSDAATLSERAEMIGSYFDDDTRMDDDGINSGLLRLSFVNTGSFVIDLYDQGRPGDSYAYAAAVAVPRFIWPDKPILTDVARDLSFEMTGNRRSSIAPGLASEAYWNFGWIGVVLIGTFTGLVLCLWSIYTLGVQVSGAWHLFPIVLLGALMGSRINGFFVVDILGPLSFAIVGHFLLLLANAALPRATSVRPLAN